MNKTLHKTSDDLQYESSSKYTKFFDTCMIHVYSPIEHNTHDYLVYSVKSIHVHVLAIRINFIWYENISQGRAIKGS